MKNLILFFLFGLSFNLSNGQGCCSGGSGSPIAGSASQGVLSEKQIEISSSFQYLSSDKFKTGDKDTINLFDHYYTSYLYSKIGYGITEKFTLSFEMGYFLNKTQVELYDSVLNKSEERSSSGISDIIIFPRYSVFSGTKSELTLGLGYKIPVGKYDDSIVVYTNPFTGKDLYAIAPPLIQPTTGSHDLIGYAFFIRKFPRQFKFFANATYILKGWNPLGEKFGDFSSVGLFVSKSFFNTLGVTLQLRGEHIAPIQAAKNIDLLANYNIDMTSTGSKKISFTPQVSFTHNSFTIYALSEIPLYEYVNGTQIASKHLITFGFAYRFFATKNRVCENDSDEAYQCEMRCKGGGSNEPGNCSVCGMKLKKVK